MKYKNYVSGAIVGAVCAGVAVMIPFASSFANAATVNANIGASVGIGMGGRNGPHMMGGAGSMGGVRPAVFGEVSSINGDSLTVTEGSHPGFGTSAVASATTTYTIDATNATVYKNNATSTVSSVAVGDMVAVQGSVNGTNVTATVIRDGFAMRAGGPGGRYNNGTNASSTSGWRHASSTPPVSPITGNGQPVIAGTISAINGSSLTVTNKSNVSYTVDASNAKIVEGQTTVAITNLSVGDSVIIQGAVSGTSVTASSVIDQKAPSSSGASGVPPRGTGIFGMIGGFFSRIFGF